MRYHSAIFLFDSNSCSVVFELPITAAKNGVAKWFYRCTAVRPCTDWTQGVLILCIYCRKHAERHTTCRRCCVAELGCSPWTRVSSGADVDGLPAPGIHATHVCARCDETGGCHITPVPIAMVAWCLQVLPTNFEEVNYAVCRRDPEKGKGSKLSGVSLDFHFSS